jgi:hypothetical protein
MQSDVVMHGLDNVFTPTVIGWLTDETSPPAWCISPRTKGPWHEALMDLADIEDYIDSSRQHMKAIVAAIGQLTTQE